VGHFLATKPGKSIAAGLSGVPPVPSNSALSPVPAGLFLDKKSRENLLERDELQQNRWALLAALFFGVSNLAQTISESWRTLPKWAQLKYAKKGQKKLTREQSSPSTRASRRLGSGLLPNGRSSLKLAITPSTV
jgi:hypothetical protein